MANPSVEPQRVDPAAMTGYALDRLIRTPGTWEDKIDKINRQVEEEKLRVATEVATRRFKVLQPAFYSQQFLQLFNALVEAAEEELVAMEQCEIKWCANLVDQLGEAGARELIAELNGQGAREKVVLAMDELVKFLDVGEAPGKKSVRRRLAGENNGQGGVTSSAQTPAPRASEPALPPTPPPTAHRAGPSGLKRPSETPPRTRSSGERDFDVSTAGPLFVPCFASYQWD